MDYIINSDAELEIDGEYIGRINEVAQTLNDEHNNNESAESDDKYGFVAKVSRNKSKKNRKRKKGIHLTNAAHRLNKWDDLIRNKFSFLKRRKKSWALEQQLEANPLYRKRKGVEYLSSGDRASKEFPRNEMREYSDEEHPGPCPEDGLDYFDVEAVYDVEFVNVNGIIVPEFSVEWRGYEKEHNTVERIGNLVNCTELYIFLEKFAGISIGSGAKLRSSAKRTGRLIKSSKETTLRDLREVLCSMCTEEYAQSSDKYERITNSLLEEYEKENKFCNFIGFLGPSSDEWSPFVYEFEFYKKFAKDINSLNSDYTIYDKVIGHPFRDQQQLRLMVKRDEFKNTFVNSNVNIAKDFRKLLGPLKNPPKKGIIAFLVKRLQMAKISGGSQVHLRLLIVSKTRKVYYYDAYDTSGLPAPLIEQLAKALIKGGKVEMLRGTSEGHQCVWLTFKYILKVLQNEIKFD